MDRSQSRSRASFEGDPRLEFHLAPPFLGRKNAQGEAVKSSFGPWIMPAFRLLAALKALRGTRFDVFGYTKDRRIERQLITDYEILIEEILANLSPDNHAIAVALASIPEKIRGYGHVKTKHFRRIERKLITDYENLIEVILASLSPTICDRGRAGLYPSPPKAAKAEEQGLLEQFRAGRPAPVKLAAE